MSQFVSYCLVILLLGCASKEDRKFVDQKVVSIENNFEINKETTKKFQIKRVVKSSQKKKTKKTKKNKAKIKILGTKEKIVRKKNKLRDERKTNLVPAF